MRDSVGVGLLGCGNVGSAVFELIGERGADIAARTGAELRIVRVAVRDLHKQRPVSFPAGVLTDEPEAVVNDPDVGLVVELMGGVEPARTLVLAAFAAG